MLTCPTSPHRHQDGFTLVELVIVIVVVAVLAAVGIMNSPSPAELSLPSQAEKMASDLRHAQTLAHTSGNRLSLTIDETNDSYAIGCVAASPCPQAFTGQIEKGVQLTVTTGPNPIEFDTLGQPKTTANAATSASYTLTYDTSSTKISIAPLTGFVSVTPP